MHILRFFKYHAASRFLRPNIVGWMVSIHVLLACLMNEHIFTLSHAKQQL